MKFTFKKYLIKLLIGTILINIIFIVLALLMSEKDSLTLFFIVTALSILDISSFKEIFCLRKFIRENKKAKLKKLEYDLSNNYLVYDNWYLTDEYIFSLKELIKINYQDIMVVEGGLTLKGGHNNLGYKQTIYLKDGKKYKLKSDIARSNSDIFKEIITKKNPSTYFGIIEDYMKVKNKKRGLIK